MTPPLPPTPGPPGIFSPLQLDRAAMLRAIRFTATVMAPVAVTLVTGPQHWLVYAMVSSIVAFAGDGGGPPLARLVWMLTGPIALSLGLAFGAATIGDMPAVLALSMAAGLAYGLVETAHPHLLLATRFFAFGIVLAGLVTAPTPTDYLAIAMMLGFAWAISLLFDRFSGRSGWLPLSIPPAATILPSLHGNAQARWAFAISVSLAMGAALMATALLGSLRPSWACLTILMVMRSQIVDSVRLAVERILGTLGGVVLAVAIAHVGNHRLTLLAMVLAAFIRWPAQQMQNALGVFSLTLFVLLMVELITPDPRQTAILLHERLYDTVIGAIAAGLGLLLYRALIATQLKRKNAAANRT